MKKHTFVSIVVQSYRIKSNSQHCVPTIVDTRGKERLRNFDVRLYNIKFRGYMKNTKYIVYA